ncbi:hypothetical protein ACSSNL_01475 [Thalassobius sp. S69A]|uniref:hypothetical protein n=1 Tax=unclassified Thalassovita TaxID=2619711 RepID=UPI000C0D7E72|nr:hypothetical protein [Paracoccaceae bacterium]|tara:strand:- start:56 stop:259 length:204 start_codon:yes stop_codon:yes gene_type:complete
MASPAEIANDMEARARLLSRTHVDDNAQAMKRAAACIRDLIRENEVLAHNTTVTAIVTLPGGQASTD